MNTSNPAVRVEQFQRFLQPGSRSWILALYGSAGTDETALLRQLRHSLPAGWLPLDLDFRQAALRNDYEGLVRILAEGLRPGGIPPEAWAAFQGRAEQIRRLKQTALRMGMQVRGGSTIQGSAQEVRLGEEEKLRVLEAARELAYAWLELADQVQATPVVFVDHWGSLLDGGSREWAVWLFEDLLGRQHRWRPQFRMVIASDRPLRRDWLLVQRVRPGEVMEWDVGIPASSPGLRSPGHEAGRPVAPEEKEAQMDISVLVEFFKQLSFLHLPAPIYGSYMVARVIVGLFKTVGFDLDDVKQLLARLGVKVKDALLPVLVEKAREGIEALMEWLRGQAEEPEVNEATASIVASQAEAAGEALDEAGIGEDRQQQTAKQVEEAMKALGGAYARIAEAYAQALLKPDMREVLMAKMAEDLQTWQKQSIEVRRNSLVKGFKQTMEGDMPAEQRAVVEDSSKLIDSEQRIGPAQSGQ